MDPSRRVWKWTGAVLAAACSALIILHVLLLPGEPDSNPPAISPSESPGPDAIRLAPSDQSESKAATRASETPEPVATPDSKSEISEQSMRNETARSAGLDPRLKDSEVIVEGKPPQRQDLRDPASIDNRQSPIANSIRPLGIVEKADGRVVAVIQDGEWTRLAEEGDILADNSRVLKVSAEGVEIQKVQGKPEIVLAESKRPAVLVEAAQARAATQSLPPESEWASSGQPAQRTASRKPASRTPSGEELPGFEQGGAAYRPPSAPKVLRNDTSAEVVLAPPTGGKVYRNDTPAEAKSTPMGAPIRRPEVGFVSDPGSGHSGVLGKVTHADGRVETVHADGQWVRLAPLQEPPVAPSAPSGGSPSENLPTPVAVPPGSGSKTARAQDIAANPALPQAFKDKLPAPEALQIPVGRIQIPADLIQNLVEPIGIVEWADGRAKAVVATGDSISFVEGVEAVEHTRRLLALMTPPEGPIGDTAFDWAEPPSRLREDETALLGFAEGGENPRAPPEDFTMSLPEPAEIARGQPDGEAFADWSRPPPAFDVGENGLWIEGLPGIEATPAAKIGLSQLVERHSTTILRDFEGAKAGSLSEKQVEGAGTPPGMHSLRRARPDAASTDSQPTTRVEGRVLTPLGFVRWPDGRAQAVVLFEGAVILVQEGESLADGSMIEKVSPEGVVIAPPGAADPTRAGIGVSHREPPGPHQTIHQPSGTGLQSEAPIRDNRGRSRR